MGLEPTCLEDVRLPRWFFPEDDRAQLRTFVQSTSQLHGLVQQARIVLACAEGLSNVVVAERLGVCGADS